MRLLPFASLFLVLCGTFAGWLVTGLLPPPPRDDEPAIWNEDYRLDRKPSDAFEVTDARWLRIPRLIADFDLQMDVELSENMDLDLLVRQVEPRLLQGQMLPFHGRFAALRLSTAGEGPPWLARDEVLFGERGRGAGLAPGYMATVWVQGRGRLLRANVAGKVLPWFAADDDYGTFTLVARGGKAIVHRLLIRNHGYGNAWLAAPWFWLVVGAGCGLFVLGTALGCGVRGHQLLLAGIALTGLVGYQVATCGPLERLHTPEPGALLGLLGGAGLFVAGLVMVVGVRRRVPLFAALGILCGLQLAAIAAVRASLRAVPTPQVDAVFGPVAGSSLAEAHAQLVRGPFGLHGPAAPDHAGKRVMLLGGQLLYGRLRAAEEHIEPLLRGELRGALRLPRERTPAAAPAGAQPSPVEVMSLPTTDGYAEQQWAMFTRFFAAGHRPHAIVFGVSRDEAAVDAASGRPRSFPSTLEAVLRHVRAYGKANHCVVVVFTEAGLSRELMAVLRAAEAEGVPVVVAGETDSSAELAKRLAVALVPGLQ